MKNKITFGEIIANNQRPYAYQISINSKPALTGFGVTLSKNNYIWHTSSPVDYTFQKS